MRINLGIKTLLVALCLCLGSMSAWAVDTDCTSSVNASGWLKSDGNAAGVTATEFSPAVAAGQMYEVYETTTATTGVLLYQNLSGLTNGVYQVELYANAMYTKRQEVAQTSSADAARVYLYANSQTIQVNAIEATQTATNGEYTLRNVVVTDGTLRLGMIKNVAGTNWHNIQIKSLTLLEDPSSTWASYVSEASVSNPIDVSFLIQNRDIEVDGLTSGNVYQKQAAEWTNCTTTNYRPWGLSNFSNTSGAFTGGNAYECWRGENLTGQIKQTLTGIPNGVYKLQLGAFVGALNGQFVYAKSDGTSYKTSLTVGNDAENCEVMAVVSDGTLEIGLDMNDAGVQWAAIDNARLTYYGSKEDYDINNHAITSIPASFPLNAADAVNPFDVTDIVTGTAVTALRVSNKTATAWFDSDFSAVGNQPYELTDNERINISFNAYHGWYNTSKTSSVSLYLPNGKELVGYTYNIKACNVTDVRIGGVKVNDAAFSGQANSNTNNKNANGFSGNSQYYVTTAGYNPEVTMTVDGAGYVTFRFLISSRGIDKTFTGYIDTEGEAIQLEKIVITDNCDNSDRAVGINNLSITSEAPTIQFLPFTADFSSSKAPFDNGTVVDATNVGKILHVNNTTTTATFGGKNGIGWNYAPSKGEAVTIEFDAYNGYLNSAKTSTSTVSVLNSEGKELVGYTYNTNSYVTDVKLGGASVEDFEQFIGISKYNGNTNANGYLDGNKPFVTTTGYNPHITMTISGSGKVSFKFECSGQSVDKYYEATLDNDVMIDIASIKIVDNNNTNFPERSSCYDNFSITSETEKMATPTITTESGKTYFASSESVTITTKSEGASIYYTTDGSVPTSASLLYSEPIEIDATTTVKAITIKDGYSDSDIASAKISKLYEQTNVTGAETWDWSKTELNIQLTNATTPTKTEEFLLKNLEAYNEGTSIPAAFGDAQKLLVKTEYAFRKSNYCFQGSYIKFTTEVPGVLNIEFSNTGNNAERFLTINGENTAYSSSSTTKVNATGLYVAAGEVTISSSSSYLRFYKIVFTPTKLNSAGYSTFSSSSNIQVTGADAYTAKIDLSNNTITCNRIADAKIPAGNGVILYGTGDAPVTFTVIDSAPALSDNDLLATTAADGSLAAKGSSTYYVLSGSAFKKFTGATFTAGKAYFEAPESSRGFTMMLNDEATGIADITSAQTDNSESVFNLKGQRVSQPQKGLYIVKGKKMVIK